MQNRKRVNCYLDVETYERVKRVLDIMGVTYTDFVNQMMVEFLDKMEQVVLNNDREAFLKMMAKDVDELQKQVKEELQK